jgi:hypothetical protein
MSTTSPSRGARALIVTDALSRDVVAKVAAACTAAGAVPTCVNVDAVPSSPEPALIVGALRSGERRIPDAIVALANGTCASSILLLSDERLVRDGVTLHEGRVALHEIGAATNRLERTIRVLLTSQDVSAMRSSPRVDDGMHVRAQRGVRWWLGCAESHGGARVDVATNDDGAVTIVLPLEGRELADAAAHAAVLIDAGRDGRSLEAALHARFGARTGVVHLTAKGDEWLVWWPTRNAPMWLHAPSRLPSLFAVHASTAPAASLLRLAAAPGDVLAAFASQPFDGESTAQEVSVLLRDGAPAVLESIGSWVRSARTSQWVFVAEVR